MYIEVKIYKMKKILTFTIATLITSLAFSQEKTLVNEANHSFPNGSHNAIIITVPYGQKEIVAKALKGQFKDWKGKVSGKDNLTMIQGVIKELDKKAFDAYGQTIVEEDGTVKMIVAIDLGGAYMNSKEHAKQFNIIKSQLIETSAEAGKECVDIEIKAEEKVLSELEKQEKVLIKEQEEMQEEILNYQKKIEENKKNIEESKTAQGAKKEEIKAQKKKIIEIETKKKAIQ